jgi:hypothetical protein
LNGDRVFEDNDARAACCAILCSSGAGGIKSTTTAATTCICSAGYCSSASAYSTFSAATRAAITAYAI